MPKRFTDTDKWKKRFIRTLSPDLKLLWFYILDDCNICGLWDVDLQVAALRVGQEEISYEYAFEAFKDKIVELDNKEKWFIPEFMEFQYGEQLSKGNNIYKSIEKILVRYDLWEYLAVDIVEKGDTTSALRKRVSKKTKERIFIEADLTCQYCQERKSKFELVLDHFIPISKGGDSSDENLVCSCARCNSYKSDILPNEFVALKHDFLNPTPFLFEKINTLNNALNPPSKKFRGGKEKDKEEEKEKEKDKEEEILHAEILDPYPFEDFWNLYDKKTDRAKCEAKYLRLKEDEKRAIFETLPEYLLSTPDKQYRKNPETYLNQRGWEHEIIPNGRQQRDTNSLQDWASQ